MWGGVVCARSSTGGGVRIHLGSRAARCGLCDGQIGPAWWPLSWGWVVMSARGRSANDLCFTIEDATGGEGGRFQGLASNDGGAASTSDENSHMAPKPPHM